MDAVFQQCLNAILKTLLIFFICAASLVLPHRIELKLPDSTTGTRATVPQKLVVSYARQGVHAVIALDESPVPSLPELTARMKTKRTDPQPPPVDILIEKTVPYQQVVAVMDAVREAGFQKFSLLTLPKSPTGTE
jgi:biopolymer transport protein ExbD